MGGSNQSLFLIGALIASQGTGRAVPPRPAPSRALRRLGEHREIGADQAGGVLHEVLEDVADVAALQRELPEARDGGLPLDGALEAVLGRAQPLPSDVERLRRPVRLVLHAVEGARHRADLVVGADVDPGVLDPHMGVVEPRAPQRLHHPLP